MIGQVRDTAGLEPVREADAWRPLFSFLRRNYQQLRPQQTKSPPHSLE